MPELDIQRRPTTLSYWWMWLIGAVLLGLILWWVVIWAAAPSPQRAAVPPRAAPAGTTAPVATGPTPAASTGTTATTPPGTTTAATPRGSTAGTTTQVHERVAGSRQQISAPNSAVPAAAGAAAGAATAGSAAASHAAAPQHTGPTTSTAASLPVADIHAHPSQFFGKAVSGSARVADVVSNRAFWIEEGNNRLLVVAAPSVAQPPALSTGQIVKLQGTVSDPAKAPQSPEWPQLQSDTQQTLQKQPAFIEATSVQLPQT